MGKSNGARHDYLAHICDNHSQRISLTFRTIATFMDTNGRLFGQGAKRKVAPNTAPEDEKSDDDSLAMLKAFGAENRSQSFSWDEHYGCGFDALNFKILNPKSADSQVIKLPSQLEETKA